MGLGRTQEAHRKIGRKLSLLKTKKKQYGTKEEKEKSRNAKW